MFTMIKYVSILLKVNVLVSYFCENNRIVYIDGICLYQYGVHLLDSGKKV